MPSGRSWAVNASKAMRLRAASSLSGEPFTRNAPSTNSRSSSAASSWWAAIVRALSITLSHAMAIATPPTGERARAVGVHARAARSPCRECSTSTSSGSTPSLSATIIDHARLVALAVRRGAGDDLHLAGRQHPHRGRLPAAGRVVQRRQHPARGQAAHLEVASRCRCRGASCRPRRSASACSAAQLVVADQLERLGRAPARSRRESYDEPGCTTLYGNWSVGMKLRRRISTGSTPTLRGQRVHRPLDGVGGLGAAGAAVGVGRRHVREHRRAREGVRRDVVDAVVEERAEQRDAGRDELEVGAHVGEQAGPARR